MKAAFRQARSPSLVCVGTEMAGQGPQKGGMLVLRLGRTDGAPLEEVCLVGSEGWSELTRPLNKSMAP